MNVESDLNYGARIRHKQGLIIALNLRKLVRDTELPTLSFMHRRNGLCLRLSQIYTENVDNREKYHDRIYCWAKI